MPLGQFFNDTGPSCAPPLLDQSSFGSTQGYQEGRYCGLGSFDNGTTCCFPCPIQDWLYPPEWKQQVRVPNYLSILSVGLCCFLLLSFAVLPPAQTHRHYLSVGLLFPVLFISLSFVIPVALDPPLCYDAITPNDMRTSLSCAFTGALVTLGGIGCCVWVFLRSLWLHIRIFWDRDPGRKFQWGSIAAGTVLPLTSLIALLTSTGFSYRMGQTCLPNHDNAIVTFWIWLVIFAVAGFILQAVTTGYCVFVYLRTRRRERNILDSHQRGQAMRKQKTWRNVKKLFILQWRNIAVSILTIIGSVAFFIVFWTQDSKLGRVFNDPNNIIPVKMWIICQTLSRGDKKECRNYVSNFTVPRGSVLASLILASLVGIEIFILLFRPSMLRAWRDLLGQLLHRARTGRPPTPELTSLENPDQYIPPIKPIPMASAFNADTPSSTSYSKDTTELEDISPTLGTAETGLYHRPGYERVTSDTRLLAPQAQQFQSVWEDSSAENSRANTPQPPFVPQRDAPSPPARTHSSASALAGTKSRRSSFLARARSRPLSWSKKPKSDEAAGSGEVKRTKTTTSVRGTISTPVPGSFVHVNGVPVSDTRPWSAAHDVPREERRGYGDPGGWPGEADSWEGGRV